jgi:hypothetical protein
VGGGTYDLVAQSVGLLGILFERLHSVLVRSVELGLRLSGDLHLALSLSLRLTLGFRLALSLRLRVCLRSSRHHRSGLGLLLRRGIRLSHSLHGREGKRVGRGIKEKGRALRGTTVSEASARTDTPQATRHRKASTSTDFIVLGEGTHKTCTERKQSRKRETGA